uniref:Espin like a n=1 Tax=Callorhinchus milii TaxID=7868 RepID=A0A4W3I8N8_CALMI|eukprot:gi/632934252/ref/XP_007904871.1/ PREDICTED: espin-like protein isoform X1 [Callorhinchus milii]
MVPHRCILAAKTGDLQTLKDLDASGNVNEDIEDSLGATPVHHAARAGNLDCLKFLISDAKLPGNKKAKNGATPAHDAAATGNLLGLQWLTSVGGCNIQERDDSGASVLHLAARFGRSEMVQWLVKEGCDPMVETNSGAVPAHYAAAKGDLMSLKLLIVQAPRTLNKQTQSGATPLYLACQEGHLHVVEYLVKECGAFLDLRAHDGMTAFHAAAQMGHSTVVAWLASLPDMDLSAQDNEGASAMHFAASGGHARILEQLITMRAKILKDHWGGTPLHDAAENGELECCQILVMNQVDPTIQDKDGYTARKLANYNGHMECANYLRRMENMPLLKDNSPSLLKEDSFRRSKSIVRRQSGGDYYRSFNEGRRELLNFPKEMENDKDTILVKSEAPIYPQPPPLPPPQPTPQLIKSQPLARTTSASNSYHCTSNVKPFNMVHPTDDSSEHIVELKSETLLKTVGFTTVFVGNSGQLKQTFEEDEKENGFLPLPVDEVSSIDVDSLVPTHDERGRPIPEWKRQVMVRKLQARLQDEEEARRNQIEENRLLGDWPPWKREMMKRKLDYEKRKQRSEEERKKKEEQKEMREQSKMIKQLGYDESHLTPSQVQAILVRYKFSKRAPESGVIAQEKIKFT